MHRLHAHPRLDRSWFFSFTATYALLFLPLLLSGCKTLFPARPPEPDVRLNLTEGRLSDAKVVEEPAGTMDAVFFAIPRKRYFLEGFINGMVVDFNETPIPNIGVTVESPEVARGMERDTLFEAAFSSGTTNANGIFKIKFKLPLAGGRVDVRGRLAYNKGWQLAESAGEATYRPNNLRNSFRLVYDRRGRVLIFAEEMPHTVVFGVLSKPADPAAKESLSLP